MNYFVKKALCVDIIEHIKYIRRLHIEYIVFIGTTTLDKVYFSHTSTQKAPKSITAEDFKTSGPLLSVASAQTRFQAFWDIAYHLGYAAYKISNDLSSKYLNIGKYESVYLYRL